MMNVKEYIRKILLLLILIIGLCSNKYACAKSNQDASYNAHYVVIYSFITESTSELSNTEIDWITRAIIYHAVSNNVQPLLVTALIKQESNFRHDAVSRAGAVGLTQIMPTTANGLGINQYDAWENIEGGVRYFSDQLKRFSYAGNYCWAYALAAYNAGPGAVQNYGGIPPYDETINYVQNVICLYADLVHKYEAYSNL